MYLLAPAHKEIDNMETYFIIQDLAPESIEKYMKKSGLRDDYKVEYAENYL
jgi:hypothetical protein